MKDYVNDESRKYHFAVNIADSSSQDKKPTSKSKKLISDDSDHSNNGKSKTKSKGYKRRVLTLKCVRAGKPTINKKQTGKIQKRKKYLTTTKKTDCKFRLKLRYHRLFRGKSQYEWNDKKEQHLEHNHDLDENDVDALVELSRYDQNIIQYIETRIEDDMSPSTIMKNLKQDHPDSKIKVKMFMLIIVLLNTFMQQTINKIKDGTVLVEFFDKVKVELPFSQVYPLYANEKLLMEHEMVMILGRKKVANCKVLSYDAARGFRVKLESLNHRKHYSLSRIAVTRNRAIFFGC